MLILAYCYDIDVLYFVQDTLTCYFSFSTLYGMSKAQVLDTEHIVRDEVLKSLAGVESNYMLFVDKSHISIFIDISTAEVEEQFIALFEALETLKVQVEVIDINAKCRAVDDSDISLTEAREAKSAIFIYL